MEILNLLIWKKQVIGQGGWEMVGMVHIRKFQFNLAMEFRNKPARDPPQIWKLMAIDFRNNGKI